MSKSYRYDPDEGGYADRPSWERDRRDGFSDAFQTGDVEDPVKTSRTRKHKADAKDNPYPPMSPEWAMELMKERVHMVLSGIVKRGHIAPHEKDDYTQILNLHICRMLPFYDPDRTGKSKRTASVRRYLNVVIDSAVANIVRLSELHRKTLPTCPIPELEDEDNREDERPECEGNPFRDHRKCMEELWIKMDLEVLDMKLSEEERLALKLRWEGCTFPEIVDAINAELGIRVDRYHVMNVTMENIRRAARELDITPFSERGPDEPYRGGYSTGY